MVDLEQHSFHEFILLYLNLDIDNHEKHDDYCHVDTSLE